jgi:DHA2 family methylenomycin A resistance protein-like MFS transporter
VATSLGFAVVQLDVSVVNVAIKPIGTQLGGSVSDLQWVVNAYTVAFAALILSAGALGDRVGARRVFVSGFALFTVASAACGLSPSLGFLIASRAVQGVGAAVLVPCSLSLLTHTFDDVAGRARAVGQWAAGASIALSGGPVVGGVLTGTLGWRWVFFINAPIGVLGIWLTLRYAGETTRSPDRGVDLPGQLSGATALALLSAATIEGGVHGFGYGRVLLGYSLCAVAAIGFLVTEARRASPMLPLRLFRSRAFGAATAIGLLLNVGVYGLLFVLSLYFQSERGYSPLQAGLAFAPMTGVVLGSNLLAGSLARRIGAPAVVVAGSTLLLLSAAGLLVAGAGTPYGAIVGQLVALGLGVGLVVPVMTTAVLSSVEPSWSGVASGALNTARQTGSVLGVGLFGSLLAAGLVTGLHRSLLVTLAAAVGIAALGLLLHE